MKIRIDEDKNFSDIDVVIHCPKENEQVKKIAAALQMFDLRLTGIKENQIHLLDVSKILYIETVDKHTFFYTHSDVYESQLRLYQLEEQLESRDFFRSGKSTIINFNQIIALKPDLDGRLLVTISNGEKLLVSRQYAKWIKEKLEEAN